MLVCAELYGANSTHFREDIERLKESCRCSLFDCESAKLGSKDTVEPVANKDGPTNPNTMFKG